ncbi:cingulin-like [Mizuhopecten yessoensis]|uniref:cingulin-like n=1 Tax=Mizuhopecten yessoensis TaxID=6573 RepID=UPI000B45E60A|nr:cingulin-like [Mizuhopecten yessoensis]
MEVENKENLQVPVFEKVAVDTLGASPAVCRTPLQNVNNLAVNRSTKKAYYSQVTPTLKTPGRKAAKVRQSLLVYQDKAYPDAEEVLLNSLVCKKVDEVIAKAKQQYEDQIAEKEKTIANLQDMVKAVDDTVSCGTQENKSCGTQANPIDSISRGIQFDPVENISCGIQADPVENISCGIQADPVESNSCGIQADPVESNSCGIQADPVESNSCGIQADPVESNSCGIQADPVESNSCGIQADPVESNSCGIQADPVESNSCGIQADPVESNSCGIQADPVESNSCGIQADPVESNSCGIQADPVESNSCGIQADPVESNSCGIQADPVESNSCGIQADPVESNSCGIQADPVESNSCGIQADPVESNSCGIQADPVESNSCGIQADPVESNSCGIQADPVESNSCGIQADPVESNSCGIQADPVESNSCGIQADPIESNSCGTQFDPIENVSTGTQVDGNPCPRCEQVDSDILEEQVSLYIDRIVNKCAADLKSEQIVGFINQTSEADRDHQLWSANSLIQELQLELGEHAGLSESVAMAERLQVKIQECVSDNYSKVKAAADRLTCLQAQTEQQAYEMKTKMGANDLQMKRCRQEKTEVLEKFDCMERMLEKSRESLAQMEALYKTTSAELTITKSQIQVNSSDIVSITRAYEDSQAKLREAQTRYTVDNDKLTVENKQLTEQLGQMEVTLGELHTDMAGVQTELSVAQKEVASQGETITNLTCELQQAKETIAVQQEQNQGHRNKNEVLLGSIEEKNGDIANLRQELRNMKSKLQTTEKQSESDLELMKQRCDSLLTEQALTRQAHINQVRDLEQELERRDCSGQLRTAQGVIQELQTELSEYTELADSLKLAEILQAKVQEVVNENFLKVKTAADKLLTLKRNIDKEKSEVTDQKKVNEEEKVDFEGMKSALESSQQSMALFETLYNSTSVDLLNAASQVQILNGQLDTTKSAYEACQLCREELVNKQKESEENERATSLEIQGLQVSLKAKEEELESVKKRLSHAVAQQKEREQLMQRENDHLSLAVENLQRTLDSRDVDVDQVEKELYEIREYMTEKLESMDRLKVEAETTNMEFQKCRKENMQLRDNCAVMQCSIQELKETIQSSAYELSETKSHASRMLHQQGEELRECSQSASALTTKMDTLLQELSRKIGISTQQDVPSNEDLCDENPTVEEVSENVRKQRPCKARKSFLSEIFLAASEQHTALASPLREESSMGNGSDEVGEDSPQSDQNISGIYPLQSSTEASPATISRSKLGFSSSSAFAPVRTGKSLIVPQSGPLETNGDESVSPSDNVSGSEQVSNDDGDKQEEVSQEERQEKETLAQQINTINEYFIEIIRLGNIVEKASRLSIDEVNADNEELRQHIQKLQFVEQEVVRKEKEIVQQREAIVTLEQRLENMAENLERFSDQESLILTQKSELSELRSRLRTLEGEKKVFSNQVKEAVGRIKMLESSQGVDSSASSSVAEVFSLKMKIQKLRDQLLKKDEYYEELGNKASRRLKVLEENWRRAEAEVYRFDELMEIVGQTLTKREDLVSQHQELKHLQKLIRGQKSLPSEKDSASAPLKSIKTARW